jgi:hypothetical protein
VKLSMYPMLMSPFTPLPAPPHRMFTARKKIVKEVVNGKETPIDAFEETVAQVCIQPACIRPHP